MVEHSPTALRIHADLPVIDGHNDLPWKLRTAADGNLDLADPRYSLPGYHTDIPRMLGGGVGAQFWSVYVPADIPEPFQRTIDQIDLVEAMVARDPRLELARTATDVRQIRSEGRIASLMGSEGGHSIEGSLDKLGVLFERGVRYMTLTHNDHPRWADSAMDACRNTADSPFGRRLYDV